MQNLGTNSLAGYLGAYAKVCPPEDGADLVFFAVKETPGATAEGLLAAIKGHKGQWGAELDPLDGKEHSYIELGAWAGSQSLALTLIGLGARLGLWQLLTPRTVLGSDVPNDLVKQMASAGMVTMLAPKPR